MRVIILKGGSARHNYFARQLLNIKGIDFKIISPKRLASDRLWKMLLKSPKTFFSRVTKYAFFAYLRWNKKESIFFGNNIIEDEEKVENINSEYTVGLIKNFSPDLIVAFGVPIISSKILDIPRFKAINLHGGISPEYKGGNTIFWPLFEAKPELAGATLHYMLKKVDSGKIIVKVYPNINPDDDELSVSCKTFMYATEEMVKIVSWIKENNQLIPGEQQVGAGKLYLAKHRTFLKDLKGIQKVKKNLKEVNLPFRVQRSYSK
jgi:methionyl-tRNA formyltransferase